MVGSKASLLAVLCTTVVIAQEAPRARDFGHELWSSTKGLGSSDNLFPLVAGVSLAGGSSLFDKEVQGYFGAERRAEWVGTVGNIIGNPIFVGGVSGALFLTSYKTSNNRFRAMSFDLTQGFLLDSAATVSLKYAIRRERPDGTTNNSLPSGHASATTMAATVVSYYYPKATIPMYALAGFTALSRLEKNRHWLSDVVAGSVQGFIIGKTVVRGRSIFKTGRLQWFPNVSSQGFMVNASIRLGPKPGAAD